MKTKLILIICLLLVPAILVLACGGSTSSENTDDTSSQVTKDDIAAMTTFTKAALAIEGQRNESIDTYGPQAGPGLAPMFRSYVGNKYAGEIRPLVQQIFLLPCPQSLQHIKDSLIRLYEEEIELAVGDATRSYFYPTITMDNAESYIGGSYAQPWIEAQLFRRDIYTEWRRVLTTCGLSLDDFIQEVKTRQNSSINDVWEKVNRWKEEQNK